MPLLNLKLSGDLPSLTLAQASSNTPTIPPFLRLQLDILAKRNLIIYSILAHVWLVNQLPTTLGAQHSARRFFTHRL